MEAESTPETPENLHESTQRNIPEDSNLFLAAVRTWNLTKLCWYEHYASQLRKRQ
jgi:hypothetical protein